MKQPQGHWMHSLARLCWLSLAALASATAKGQQASDIDQAQVVDTMRTMYVAATKDDLVLFGLVAAPDFYAYELGKRFTGNAQDQGGYGAGGRGPAFFAQPSSGRRNSRQRVIDAWSD